MRKILLVILLISSVSLIFAQSGNLVVHDFKFSFWRYDGNGWHTNNDQTDTDILGFWITRTHEKHLLQLTTPKQTFLVINKQLVRSCPPIYTLRIDSLLNTYKQDSLFLTFTGSKLNLRNFQAKALGIVKVPIGPSVVNRDLPVFGNFRITAALVLLILFALLYNLYPKFFKEYYQFVRLFKIRLQEDSLFASRPLNNVGLQFLGLHSLLVAYCLMIMDLAPFVNQDVSWSIWMGRWLVMSGFILVVFLLKFILLVIFAQVFDIRKIVNGQYYLFMTLSRVFTLVTAILLFMFWVTAHYVPPVYTLIGAYMIFLTLRLIIIFYKAQSATGFKNLHLFSYLCSVEIVPLVILLKVYLENIR